MNVRLSKEQKIKVANADDVFQIMRCVLMRENRLGRVKEHFWVVGLNLQSRIVYIELISLGSQSQAIVDPTEVFRFAIQKGSPQVILVHNHPSGDLTPSVQDRQLTRDLRKGGTILKIDVLDHLIISETEFLSFRAKGWIRTKS